MRKRTMLVLALSLGAAGFSAAPAKNTPPKDPIDKLITTEKESLDEWLSEGEPLPPAYLLGNKSGIQLYADFMENGNYEKLCCPIELDELQSAAQGDPDAASVTVNVGIEKVRDLIGGACLGRPKDTLLAVGPGWQKVVAAKDFLLKKTLPVCPTDSLFSLWFSLESDLPGEPLFYASGLENPSEGDIGFRWAADISTINASGEERDHLAKIVKNIADFDIRRFELSAPNCDSVYHLKKRLVKMDDLGNPAEFLIWRKGDQVEVLEMELIEKGESSGHVSLEAVMDFNGDGRTDLWVSGDQKGCPYRLLFLGSETGFIRTNLPEKPCSC